MEEHDKLDSIIKKLTKANRLSDDTSTVCGIIAFFLFVIMVCQVVQCSKLFDCIW